MTGMRLADALDHMIMASRQIASYIDGLDRAGFLADKRTQDAVVLNLIVLGEAATRVLKEDPGFAAAHPQLPWKNMKGMRNRIAHGYFEINMDLVWDTVRFAVPELMVELPPIRQAADDIPR
jgi:uncharacterized protein with HEPN domain